MDSDRRINQPSDESEVKTDIILVTGNDDEAWVEMAHQKSMLYYEKSPRVKHLLEHLPEEPERAFLYGLIAGVGEEDYLKYHNRMNFEISLISKTRKEMIEFLEWSLEHFKQSHDSHGFQVGDYSPEIKKAEELLQRLKKG